MPFFQMITFISFNPIILRVWWKYYFLPSAEHKTAELLIKLVFCIILLFSFSFSILLTMAFFFSWEITVASEDLHFEIMLTFSVGLMALLTF